MRRNRLSQQSQLTEPAQLIEQRVQVALQSHRGRGVQAGRVGGETAGRRQRGFQGGERFQTGPVLGDVRADCSEDRLRGERGRSDETRDAQLQEDIQIEKA